MSSFNRVILLGNLTRDPEVRYTPKGVAVTDIGLALNRVYTDDTGGRHEETTFVDVTFWGKSAESLGKYYSKGRVLHVEGRLTLDEWEDKETGKKRQKLRVVGEKMQFMPSKGGPQTADQHEAKVAPDNGAPY